jgi:hypothetical protein
VNPFFNPYIYLLVYIYFWDIYTFRISIPSSIMFTPHFHWNFSENADTRQQEWTIFQDIFFIRRAYLKGCGHVSAVSAPLQTQRGKCL